MRSFLAGLAVLFFLSSGAMAQVTGFVESIGIDNSIRPDCWNPIRVNLKSTISEPMQYQIQVMQEDLDKDHVVYTKDITLSPQVQEKFELYFVPQPSLGSAPQIAPGELQKSVKVRICLPPGEGKKPEDAKVVVPADRMAITFSVDNLDPRKMESNKPGVRLVLYVTDGSSTPSFRGYAVVPGLAEFADFVAVHPADLGENVLYYDAVDTVIWLSGNADELDASGSHRRAALDQFIRQGGKLVVCQPGDRHKIEALDTMLPIETKDATGNWQITFQEKAHFVDTLAPGPNAPPVDALPWLSQDLGRSRVKTTWSKMNADGKHPIEIARAKPRADAVVELWQPWSKTDKSPYIVRGPHGLGCVTWVAQDLGDVNLNGPDSENWTHVWDHVIGWRNNTFTTLDGTTERYEREKILRDNQNGDVDLSKWMLEGTNYTSKGAAYVFLAVFFFIAYWLAAGPGTYFILSRKKRKELNWFIFGAWAFAGTALTVLLVRLVLRGDAEVRHLTVVRQMGNEPAYIYSRVGLYIPRDGDQSISLENTAKDAISYVTPLQAHPQYVDTTEFPAVQEYGIPVHDDPQPVSIRVPFRSTLKKLQMRWVGDFQTNIAGSAKLIAAKTAKDEVGYIAGTLTNNTGNDLKYIYFVFSYHERGQLPRDWVLYVPTWNAGKSIDLNEEFANAKTLASNIGTERVSSTADPRDPGNLYSIKAPIENQWEKYWTAWPSNNLTGGAGGDERGKNDFETNVPKSFPLLSLFDRIAPGLDTNPDQKSRIDVLRRGGTILNMSSAVAAGRLVILAQSNSDDKPIPLPLTVEGSRMTGQGRVLYQFALPVDRAEMEKDAAKGE